MISGSGFKELGQPTVLAKHFAKEEFIERRNVRFDIAKYSQLNISEVFSGYLNQVHTSRDLEIDMVNQLHQKYEVWTPAWYIMHTLSAPKSNAYGKIEYDVDLE